MSIQRKGYITDDERFQKNGDMFHFQLGVFNIKVVKRVEESEITVLRTYFLYK